MTIFDKYGSVLIDIDVDDTSVRYKAIKGENSLSLKFSLAEHLEVPLGSYCVFKGEKYMLMLPEDLTMIHRRAFEYSIIMHSEDYRAKRYKFVNPVDGRLKFPLTAKPIDHLQMFVDNMNMRDGDGAWQVGECPDHVEILLSYNHTFCFDALVQLADKLELDYWFDGRVVNIGKLEIDKDSPLPLSYGGDGLGLKSNIKRTNFSDALPLEVLYVEGTTQNIDPSKYGSNELHLPKSYTIGYDGEHFSDETGFDASKARYYKTDANGYSVSRNGKEIVNHSEDSLNCTEIEPTKEEEVKSVVEVNEEKHFYDILFESDVDYSKYVIEGEQAYIVFQSGMLAGKEFDLATDTNGNLICKKEGSRWRVEIVPQDIDGITMPDKKSGYIPVQGNTFKVFGIQLPDEYIEEAEVKMLKHAIKHFYTNEEVQYTISGELDEIYAKRNWETINSKLRLGRYVSFTDKSFQEEPLLIRITGIKEYVNKPYSPIIEISNAALAGTLIGELNRIENQEAETDDKFNKSIQFTKRRFRSAQETLTMLQSAFKNFSDGINPVTVQTMSLLVGDESLQFKFISTIGTSVTPINIGLSYKNETKTLNVGRQSRLMHMTLGIDSITAPSSRGFDDYKRWAMPAWESGVLDDAEKSYYLYARVPVDGTSGEFLLSETSIGMNDESGYYHLLIGILNAEYADTREFVSLYGFTEILPARITTDKIVSADGNAVLDLVEGLLTFGDKVGLSASEGAEENLRIWAGSEAEGKDNAPFRVYDSGKVFASLLHLLSGCTIGNAIRIEDGKMVIDLPDNNAKVTISEDGLVAEGFCTAAIGHCGGAGVQGFANGAPLTCPTSPDGKGVGVNGEAQNGGYAFFSGSGMFAGLRPMTKVITANGGSAFDERNNLGVLDHSVLVYISTGVCYLALPSSPQDGQEYHIESHGATLNIIASQSTWMSKSKSVVYAGTPFTHDGSGILRLKFYKQINQWQCTAI